MYFPPFRRERSLNESTPAYNRSRMHCQDKSPQIPGLCEAPRPQGGASRYGRAFFSMRPSTPPTRRGLRVALPVKVEFFVPSRLGRSFGDHHPVDSGGALPTCIRMPKGQSWPFAVKLFDRHGVFEFIRVRQERGFLICRSSIARMTSSGVIVSIQLGVTAQSVR